MARKKEVHRFPVHQTFTKSELIAWAFEMGRELELPAPSRFVLVALAHSAGYNSRECWPSVRTIARDTGLGRRTATRAVAQLADLELIERWQRNRRGHRGRTSNGYRINIRRAQLSQREVTENRLRIADEQAIASAERMFAKYHEQAVDKPCTTPSTENDLSATQAHKYDPVDKPPKAARTGAGRPAGTDDLSATQAHLEHKEEQLTPGDRQRRLPILTVENPPEDDT